MSEPLLPPQPEGERPGAPPLPPMPGLQVPPPEPPQNEPAMPPPPVDPQPTLEPQPVVEPQAPADFRLAVDLQAAAQQAREEEARNPLRAVGLEGQSNWKPAGHLLFEPAEDGTPLRSDRRPSDLFTSEQYGPESRQTMTTVNQLFADERTSEMHFNGPGALFVKRDGQRLQVCDPQSGEPMRFSTEDDYNRFLADLVHNANTDYTWEKISRRGRAVLRLAGGDRMALITPPIAEYIQASIHKIVARTWEMQTIVDNGTMTANIADFLQHAVRARANVLIVGAMGAGKSTLLSLLCQDIARDERVALIEEVGEVFLDLPDLSRFTYYPEPGKTINDVLDTALYMRYSRVIISELHDRGAYLMLRTMAKGGDGSMTTFHAGSASQAVAQIRNHVILEHPDLSPAVAADFIRQALDLIVVVDLVDGQHRVTEVSEVEWRDPGGGSTQVGLNQLFTFDATSGQFLTHGRLDEHGHLREKFTQWRVPYQPGWFSGAQWMNS